MESVEPDQQSPAPPKSDPCGCADEAVVTPFPTPPDLQGRAMTALAERMRDANERTEFARATAEAALIFAGAALAFAVAVYLGRSI